MIIFYDKKTGDILGTINGRVHGKHELKMWIGDRKTTERVVIQWKPITDKIEEVEREEFVGVGVGEDGEHLYKRVKIKRRIAKKHWEPDCSKSMKDLMARVEKKEIKIRDCIFKGGKLEVKKDKVKS